MTRAWLAFLMVCCLAAHAACGSSASNSAHGQLCAPATSSCPSSIRLDRAYPGKNIVDIKITNRGPRSTVTILIGSPGDQLPNRDALGDGTDETAPTSPPSSSGILERFEMRSGSTRSERFVATELFTRNSLQLSVGCRPCDGCTSACDTTVEYVRLTERLDCETDEDCRGDQMCNSRLGACVECTDNSDCQVEQRCNTTNGRCVPPLDAGGCATADSHPRPIHLLLVVGALIAAAHRRLRTSSAASMPSGPMIAGLVAALLVTWLPICEARAQGVQSTLSLETGLRFPTNSLARHVKRGIGITLRETLRGRHVGASASVGTNYFLTTQPQPPFSRELQMYEFGLGPRGYIPIGDVELMVGADYRRLGLGPNALVTYTGTSPNFHGLGVLAGLHYQVRGLQASASVAWRPTLGLELGMIAVNLGIGVTSQ